MSYFLFNVWKNNQFGYDEVLVAAETQEEAESKLSNSKIEYDDYSFEEEVYYSDVVI